MSLFLILLAQAAGPDNAAPIDLSERQPCQAERSSADEIVVCGTKNEPSPYRIKQPLDPSKRGLPKAIMKIGDGVNVAAEAEGAEVGGVPSNRLMVGLKIKF